MPQNLELKAKSRSLEQAERTARRLHARFIGAFRQTDTYFDVPSGRLKLREIGNAGAELILYHRPDRLQNRFSTYRIIPAPNPSGIKRLLKTLYGLKIVVRKRRAIYLLKNARIHLDRIPQLGGFLEFEVVVRGGVKQAEELMRFLVTAFGVRRAERIRWSYSDLLLKTKKRRRR